MKLVALLSIPVLLSACWPCDHDDETGPTVESTVTTALPNGCEPYQSDCYTSPPSAAPPCDIEFPGMNPWACDSNVAPVDGCQVTEFAVVCPGSTTRTLHCCP